MAVPTRPTASSCFMTSSKPSREMSRLAVGPVNRIQVYALVPRRVAPVEEIETGGRTLGKGRILSQAPLELPLRFAIALHHIGGNGLLHVGFHVFLGLERVVEEPPSHERVGLLRLAQRHHDMRPPLGKWDAESAPR